MSLLCFLGSNLYREWDSDGLILFIYLVHYCYLTSECIELVRYQIEHLKRNSTALSSLVLFCLLHKHLTNKDKLKTFMVQKENTLPFIRGAKQSK